MSNGSVKELIKLNVLIIYLIVKYIINMERTYFNTLPGEILDIILCKLILRPEVHAFTEGLNLEENKVFRTLSIHICDYIRDIPLNFRLKYRKLSWKNVYSYLTRLLPGYIYDRTELYSNGLIEGECLTECKISKDRLLYKLYECNELFYMLLYKFNISKEGTDKLRLSSVLMHLIRGIKSIKDNLKDPLLDNLLQYRTSYCSRVISIFKVENKRDHFDLAGVSLYTDSFGFALHTYDVAYLCIYIKGIYNNGILRSTNPEQHELALDLGYMIYT